MQFPPPAPVSKSVFTTVPPMVISAEHLKSGREIVKSASPTAPPWLGPSVNENTMGSTSKYRWAGFGILLAWPHIPNVRPRTHPGKGRLVDRHPPWGGAGAGQQPETWAEKQTEAWAGGLAELWPEMGLNERQAEA